MLAKRFSFVVIVILLNTLVKIVRSYHCLFVIFSFFYFSDHSCMVNKDVQSAGHESDSCGAIASVHTFTFTFTAFDLCHFHE